MNAELATLLAVTALGVTGILLIATPPSSPTRRRRPTTQRSPWPIAIGLACGTVVLAASGWALPALTVGVGTGWFSRSIGTRRARDRSGLSDALASWVENLRDVLLAGEQPIGAIRATVPTCPDVIRPAVNRLAIGLGRRDAQTVLREFADEIDDPLGDLIAVGLIIAVERGGRTVDVLSSLADQARAQADRRRLVEAERAPVRREVTLLTVIMACLVLGLILFGRAEYFSPFDEPGGQLFLAIVLVIYGGLLLRVRMLAAYPAPRRFLSSSGRLRRRSPTGSRPDGPAVFT